MSEGRAANLIFKSCINEYYQKYIQLIERKDPKITVLESGKK